MKNINSVLLSMLFLLCINSIAAQEFVYKPTLKQYLFKNENGKLISELRFDSVEQHWNDYWTVMVDGKYGLLSQAGVLVFPCEYEELVYRGTYVLLKKDGLFATGDLDGSLLSDHEFEVVDHWGKEHSVVKKNGEWGLLTKDEFVLNEDLTFFIPDRPALAKVCANDPKRECTERAIFAFIGKNLRYPAKARKNEEEGIVVAEFIVSKEGEIHSPKILRGVSKSLDAETIRVINKLPAMIPGEVDGKAVATILRLPIRFRLQ